MTGKLTEEDMEKVLIDMVTGRKPPRITGKEADKLRTILETDVKRAKENGYTIALPAEWQVDTEGELS